MRKFIMFFLIVVLIFSFIACGNKNYGFGNYTFTHARISDHINAYCVDIDSWHDNDMGIELHTYEYGNVYVSEGSYILFGNSEDCPFHGKEE